MDSSWIGKYIVYERNQIAFQKTNKKKLYCANNPWDQLISRRAKKMEREAVCFHTQTQVYSMASVVRERWLGTKWTRDEEMHQEHDRCNPLNRYVHLDTQLTSWIVESCFDFHICTEFYTTKKRRMWINLDYWRRAQWLARKWGTQEHLKIRKPNAYLYSRK